MHEILTLGDIELGVSHPVTQGALVHDGQPGHMVHGLCFRNPVSGLADDQHNFPFIIQLGGFRWPPQWLAMAGKGIDGAHEQARPFRLSRVVLVFGVAVGVIDANAGYFFRREHRWQVSDIGQVQVNVQPGGPLHHVGQGLIREYLMQGSTEAGT